MVARPSEEVAKQILGGVEVGLDLYGGVNLVFLKLVRAKQRCMQVDILFCKYCTQGGGVVPTKFI